MMDDEEILEPKDRMYPVEIWEPDEKTGEIVHKVEWITEEEMIGHSQNAEAEERIMSRA